MILLQKLNEQKINCTLETHNHEEKIKIVLWRNFKYQIYLIPSFENHSGAETFHNYDLYLFHWRPQYLSVFRILRSL